MVKPEIHEALPTLSLDSCSLLTFAFEAYLKRKSKLSNFSSFFFFDAPSSPHYTKKTQGLNQTLFFN